MLEWVASHNRVCPRTPGNGTGMPTNLLRRITLICALAAAVALPALATANDADVRRIGQCTTSAFSKIKLSPENGRIEI